MSASITDRATKSRAGARAQLPLAAAVIILAGCLVCCNSSGYLVDGADTSGYTFAGVASEGYDATGESAGDTSLNVEREGVWKFASSGLTQADVGKAAYVLDNQTVVPSRNASLANHIYVGQIVEVVDATNCYVQIRPGARDPNFVRVTVDLAGVNAGAVSTATANVDLGGAASSGVYVKKVHSMQAYVTSTGAGATATRRVITTHYTLASGVITTVGDDSLNRLITSLTGVVKE